MTAPTIQALYESGVAWLEAKHQASERERKAREDAAKAREAAVTNKQVDAADSMWGVML